MADSSFQTDVAIIGGGGAGIPAAIEVARAGGKAIVLEQAAECGGTAAISGGGCCIVGTPLQKSLGIEDTPDMAFDDWVKWGGGAADEVWARFYLEHTLHDLYHWAESCGAKWVDMKFQEGNRVHRWHRPDNNGLGLMTALIKTAQSLPMRKNSSSRTAGSVVSRRRETVTRSRFAAETSSSPPAVSIPISIWFSNTARSSKNSKLWKAQAWAPRAPATK
jgi:succinate dehydrogenase/fumarate reductase flavoprotein subunit